MTPAAFHFEPLVVQHDRKSFRCGEDALDRYLQTQATQDIRRNIANCFVAVEIATGKVAAYYTLSAGQAASVSTQPPNVTRHMEAQSARAEAAGGEPPGMMGGGTPYPPWAV